MTYLKAFFEDLFQNTVYVVATGDKITVYEGCLASSADCTIHSLTRKEGNTYLWDDIPGTMYHQWYPKCVGEITIPIAIPN